MRASAERERLHRDVFPAEVTDGATVMTGVRAFVTDRRLVVYGLHPEAGTPVCVVQVPLAETAPANRSNLQGTGRLDLTTEDGRRLYVNRGAGCGCSSPLKVMPRPVDW